MIEFFLSSSISCSDAGNLINRIRQQRDILGSQTVKELIFEVKNYVPECFNERSVQHQ